MGMYKTSGVRHGLYEVYVTEGYDYFSKTGRRRRRRRIISNEHEHEHVTVWQPILEHQIRPSAPSSVISRPTCFSSSLRC